MSRTAKSLKAQILAPVDKATAELEHATQELARECSEPDALHPVRAELAGVLKRLKAFRAMLRGETL